MKDNNLIIYKGLLDTPIGNLTIIAQDQGIIAVSWEEKKGIPKSLLKEAILSSKQHPHIKQCKKQLTEYFNQKRKVFDLTLHITGTEFQKKAYHQLLKIPYGKTISYQEQAKRIIGPNYARACGMANGQNPIAIIIPCHRVIGKNGKLIGYASGTDKKSFLLNLEQANL